MANEMEITYQGSATIYATLRRQDDSYVWNTATADFEAWVDTSLADYTISLNSAGGDLYQGNWPAEVVAGDYRVLYYTQIGGSPDVTDLLIGTADHYWNGQVNASQSTVSADPYLATPPPTRPLPPPSLPAGAPAPGACPGGSPRRSPPPRSPARPAWPRSPRPRRGRRPSPGRPGRRGRGPVPDPGPGPSAAGCGPWRGRPRCG